MDRRKATKFGPMIYTQKIYLLYIALSIYIVCIYIGKSCDSILGKPRRGKEISPGSAEPPPGAECPAPAGFRGRGFTFWEAGGVMGGQAGETAGKWGLVSKLGCNLRKCPGSVGGGCPRGWGCPAPGGEGWALGGAVLGGHTGEAILPTVSPSPGGD